jgi:hypothetical protein
MKLIQAPTLVLIESPFSGEVERNVAYAKAAMRDSLGRGEAPFVMHLHYPLVLDDTDPVQRAQGIACGLAWGTKAHLTAVYIDLGISSGMRIGITQARLDQRPVEPRVVPGWRWPQ